MTTYYYYTVADGRCEYSTKKAAIRNATNAGAFYVRTATERVVWCNPKGGEERGLITDIFGRPAPDWVQKHHGLDT